MHKCTAISTFLNFGTIVENVMVLQYSISMAEVTLKALFMHRGKIPSLRFNHKHCDLNSSALTLLLEGNCARAKCSLPVMGNDLSFSGNRVHPPSLSAKVP